MRHKHQWTTKRGGDGKVYVTCESCHAIRGRVVRHEGERRDTTLREALAESLSRPRTRSREAARRARQVERGVIRPTEPPSPDPE